MEMSSFSVNDLDSAQDDDAMQRAFAPLINLPAWKVMKGQGNVLSMDFGAPHLSINEPHKRYGSRSKLVREMPLHRQVAILGEWHLCIDHCHWRLLINEEQKVCSEDPDKLLHEAAMVLDGQILVSVAVNQPLGTSRFCFDLGACLETRPVGDGDDKVQWYLTTLDGRTLNFLANGKHSLELPNGGQPLTA
jgi:hypothetical protein